ncbi:MAG: fasciclin domain-containing protein [Ilumatobacter sp.]|nr:fasciclin domain-containing protein [Ilumatobacter sp.]
MSPSTHRRAGGPLRTCLAALAAVVVASCGGVDPDGRPANSTADPVRAEQAVELADVLRDHGLTSASSAVELVGLDALTDATDFTFFVPSDEAFQSLGADEIADLFSQTDRLTTVLRGHLVPGRTTAAELVQRGVVATEGGTQLDIAVDADGATIGGVTIVDSDIEVGSGGLVHVIDQLLVGER